MEDYVRFIGEVKLDFSAYDDRDFYSDGDIEEEILSHFIKGDEENFLRNDNRFPVLYHLSTLRNLLLEWFPIKENESVLEIGCGMGALTGILTQKGATVEAVELSPRRASVCALRNQDKKNLTIHVGNLNAINFDKKFDYVFLIGVLEYAAKFTHTKNPQIDFLNKCKSFLKPDGALVIAIENRLGIEYFSGKPEDHTGRVFDGIIDYPQQLGVKTFARSELKKLLNTCGLIDQKFFYPYPDYKFPYFIHSDEMLPTAAEFAHFSDIFYDTNRLALFPISRALPTIINAGLYQEFANSFLVVASQNHKADRVFPLKIFSNNFPRKPKYELRTEIHTAPTESGFVVKKIARNPIAREHLRTMVENCRIFSAIYGAEHVAQMKLVSDDTAEMEYIDGMIFEDYLCRLLEEGGANAFVKGLTFYFQNILRGNEDNRKFPDDLAKFNSPNRQYKLDLNFRNIMIRNDTFVLFDYEFLFPSLPKRFVAWRTFQVFYSNCSNICERYGIDLENLMGTLELTPDTLEEYLTIENAFAYALMDTYDRKYRKKRLPIKY